MLVFNFHHVEQDLKRPERKHITVTPAGLKRFIGTLRALGLEIVSLRDALANPGWIADNRKVALTFDDGYENNYDFAAPVLEAEHCPATIFVLPGRFEGTNEWDQGDLPEAQRDRLMTLDQMRALARSPYITFGSHGMLHRDMKTLPDEEIQWELQESHRILQESLGDSYLPLFAYPWGHYDDRVLSLMEASPYQAAFTVETAPWKPENPRFEIPRYSAYYRDGNPFVFIAKLARHKVLF
jgi:peptidoglycan/xylan/chitin deacetylase (PgdA/CDA1 family)